MLGHAACTGLMEGTVGRCVYGPSNDMQGELISCTGPGSLGAYVHTHIQHEQDTGTGGAE